MATTAEFSIPADEFPLGHLFETLPDVTIEIERVVPTNHAILPYFWVRGTSIERVQEALEVQGTLSSYTTIDDLGTQGLFRADWDPDVEGVLTGIVEAELTVLSATGTQDEWIFELRTEDTDKFSAFQQYCVDHGIPIELGSLHSVGEQSGTGQYGLTSEQRVALLLAYNNGYYESPPETNLEAMADELDIARQSFTDRLRRGYKNLVRETIVHQ